jgi:hypothetical protein
MPARPPSANATARAVSGGRTKRGQRPRSRSVSARGTARGVLVRTSKNGVGRASPRTHQPSSFDTRRAKSPTDGGGGAFGGSGPTAEPSNIRQSGGPSTSSRDLPSAAWEAGPRWSVGNRRPATLGVPAQQLAGEAQASERVRSRGELHARGGHVEDVGPAGAVEHISPTEETRERLAIPAVADEAEARGWRDVAGDAAHSAAPASKRKIQGHASLTSRTAVEPIRP